MSWERAFGAFLGVLCGDAAGATLEFTPVKITAEMARRAMHMPGGGNWRVGPGQITDDSELALSLAHTLTINAPREGLPLDDIASKYHEWWRSSPYDIGNTCATAFDIDREAADTHGIGAAMVHQSARWNMKSQANGSLMRILPLAIWASHLPEEQIADAARREATLSHPNQVCQDCNAIYCIIVAHLIHHPSDRDGALKKANEFVKTQVHTVVKDWYQQESLDISKMVCTRQIGHVRWAFTLAIYHLRQGTPYEKAIQDTLVMGGDTDTNAAIVGGMLGALHGVDNIPEFMKRPVLEFDCTSPVVGGHQRPAAYRSAQVEELARALLEQAREASA